MFKEITTSEIKGNIFDMIDREWFLLSAGDEGEMNTMTCSWGTAGELWAKRVVIAYVRKTRHTLKFTEDKDYFTLSFFGNHHREALGLCGSKSGRDIDKVAATGLTPVYAADAENAPYFAEAETVFVCRKLYTDFIKEENFCLPELDSQVYGLKDYHKFYVGEIMHVYVKE